MFSARRHRPGRIGDPAAPRSGVQACAPRNPARSIASSVQAVTPEPHMLTTSTGSRPANNSRNSAANCIGDLNRPSGPKFCAYGRLIAPGTCPATRSMGSSSPRKRTAARASSNMPPSSKCACTASASSKYVVSNTARDTGAQSSRRTLHRCGGRKPNDTQCDQPPSRHRNLFMAKAAQQKPQPRRECHTT